MRNQSLLNRGCTQCYASAGLAEGTNAATIKINAPNGAGIDFSINGLMYHKADTDNIAVTATAIQADLTTCLYLVQINANGTVSTVKGNEELTADLTADRVSVRWPEPTAANCPIGGFRVVNSGGTFTGATTNLGAGTVTDTYYNFATMPVQGLE